MDQQSFRINTLTSCCLQRSRIPLTLATDREAIQAGLETCWRIDPALARVVVIPNTLELQSLWVSKSLDDEVRAHPHLTCETDFQPMPFLEDGSLDQCRLFPESVRGQRGRSGVHREA
jgi:hypothetical protein